MTGIVGLTRAAASVVKGLESVWGSHEKCAVHGMDSAGQLTLMGKPDREDGVVCRLTRIRSAPMKMYFRCLLSE